MQPLSAETRGWAAGGPFAGQVIGINTAIITGSRGYEGVVSLCRHATADQRLRPIIKQGRVTRGSIGVSFQEELSTTPLP